MWRTAALRRGACTRDFRPTIPRSNASTASATVVVPALARVPRAPSKESAVVSVSMSPIYATPTLVPRCFISRRNASPNASTPAREAPNGPRNGCFAAPWAEATTKGVTIFVTDVGTRCAQGVVRAHEVDFDCATHVFDVSAEDRRIRLDAGIGHDYVDASQLLSDVADAARYLLEIGDIAQLPGRAAAGGGDLFEKFRLEAEESDGCTAVVEASGQRRTDIAGGAGDQDAPTRQVVRTTLGRFGLARLALAHVLCPYAVTFWSSDANTAG